MGKSNVAAFRGADRRARPSAELFNISESRPIAAACAGLILCLAILPLVSAVVPREVPGDGWAISGLSALAGVAATGAWLAAWAVSGRSWPASVGLALVPAWALAEVGATPLASTTHRAAAAFAGVVPAAIAVLLLTRARRAPQVDAAFRPLRTLQLLAAIAAALVFGGGTFVHIRGFSHVPVAAIAACGTATAALFAGAGELCRRRRDGDPVGRYGLPVAFYALAVGAAERALGATISSREVASWALTCGRAISLIGWVLFLALGLATLATARATAAGRQRSLRVARDEIAQWLSDQQRFVEERRHDLRSLIAGIQSATTTLTRYREYLEPAEQRLLESALDAEITRLQRSIGVPSDSGRFALGDAIGPVITAERARGTLVYADLPDVEVIGSGEATAALVQNLVTNSRRHAPGSTVTVTADVVDHDVRLTVDDDGPGLPSEVRSRVTALFDQTRLAPVTVPSPRASESPMPSTLRRSGLGLTICARLAHEQGARLRLVETRRGTRFELALRLAMASEPSGTR